MFAKSHLSLPGSVSFDYNLGDMHSFLVAKGFLVNKKSYIANQWLPSFKPSKRE